MDVRSLLEGQGVESEAEMIWLRFFFGRHHSLAWVWVSSLAIDAFVWGFYILAANILVFGLFAVIFAERWVAAKLEEERQ